MSRTSTEVGIHQSRTEIGARGWLWWTAALPFFGLLGIALPLVFANLIDGYLYYLTPAELLPTYAISWLVLAAISIPFFFIAVLTLLATEVFRPFAMARNPLSIVLKGLFAGAIFAAIAAGTLWWVRSFGILASVPLGNKLGWASLVAGVGLAATRRGARHIRQLSTLAAWTTGLGALTLLSLPFLGWPATSLTSSTGGPPSGTSVRRPNIVLLTFDALTAGRMSLYGAPRPTTPMLQEVARRAATFERAYANSNFTTAGVSSILTGTRPWTHRALMLPSWPLLATRRDSLPALLHAAGYLTGYVSTNAEAGAAKNGLGSYFDFASYDRFKGFRFCSDRL
ncbi:MAG TPA: sulfatase-like hydrolase/transferase, partial [Steroidobacteraceae bacterium]|nr:sulfatase-like hydrolase/transferase [Steroidobacteraceae bacterium]